MVNAIMIVSLDLFPIQAGHQKAMYEISRFLHRLPWLKLKLLVLSRDPLKCPECYAEICSEAIRVQIPKRWGFYDVMNKFSCRILRSANCEAGWCAGMRRKVNQLCGSADVIIVNYIFWYRLFDYETLQRRTIVITHDIFFYRRMSFGRMRNAVERLLVKLDRRLEVDVLKRFNRICVFADYEKELLLNAGIEESRILKVGLPIQMSVPARINLEKEFEFIVVGSDIYQNEEGLRCFFTRVVPLLKGKEIRLAVAGKLSESRVLDSGIVPSNVIVRRLGYVPDLSEACSRALIGVGTVPYGSGIKVKVVEMMMNGLPVVLTNSGEEGIPVLPDGAINIDQVLEEEASMRLCKWVDEPALAIEAGARQGEMLRSAFSPEVCLLPLVSAIESIVNENLSGESKCVKD